MARTESASSSSWFDITGSQNKQMSNQLSDLGSQSTTCFDLRMDGHPPFSKFCHFLVPLLQTDSPRTANVLLHAQLQKTVPPQQSELAPRHSRTYWRCRVCVLSLHELLACFFVMNMFQIFLFVLEPKRVFDKSPTHLAGDTSRAITGLRSRGTAPPANLVYFMYSKSYL